MTLLQSIAHMEGFFTLGNRPERNNNPGDLIWCDEAERFGATHGDPKFAVFTDARSGWRALQHWLAVPAKFNGDHLIGGYLGATVSQVINRFAPPNENDTTLYINTVCRNTGLTPDTIVTMLILQTPEAL